MKTISQILCDFMRTHTHTKGLLWLFQMNEAAHIKNVCKLKQTPEFFIDVLPLLSGVNQSYEQSNKVWFKNIYINQT